MFVSFDFRNYTCVVITTINAEAINIESNKPFSNIMPVNTERI